MRLTISRLQSGGLITNYHCSSKCMHCLYASSPKRTKEYIDKDNAAALFKKAMAMGCYSLHIGGGEPLLNTGGLKQVLQAAGEQGMSIEYVETNSSWFKDHDSSCQTLEDLKQNGLATLLVSISPFHNEYIPFKKVKGVMAACRETGVSVFPWISEFYNDIHHFPDDIPHPFSEYVDQYGKNYLKRVVSKYRIHPGGRALTAFRHLYGQKKTGRIADDPTPCIELTNTSHFHLDLNGNYIPGLCSGFQIDYRDLGSPLADDRYRFLNLLYQKGIKELYRIATEEFGFVPQETYTSKCHLCLDIRRFLVTVKKIPGNELGPKEFYKEI